MEYSGYGCNVYEPPPVDVEVTSLPKMVQNSFVCGDFNSRNTALGYPSFNKNGKVICPIIVSSDIKLNLSIPERKDGTVYILYQDTSTFHFGMKNATACSKPNPYHCEEREAAGNDLLTLLGERRKTRW